MSERSQRCRCCGRALRTRRSVLLGVGPRCARRLIRALTRARGRILPARPRHVPSPDQLTLFEGDDPQ
jgi:Family of unknown function (DUF6011)